MERRWWRYLFHASDEDVRTAVRVTGEEVLGLRRERDRVGVPVDGDLLREEQALLALGADRHALGDALLQVTDEAVGDRRGGRLVLLGTDGAPWPRLWPRSRLGGPVAQGGDVLPQPGQHRVERVPRALRGGPPVTGSRGRGAA